MSSQVIVDATSGGENSDDDMPTLPAPHSEDDDDDAAAAAGGHAGGGGNASEPRWMPPAADRHEGEVKTNSCAPSTTTQPQTHACAHARTHTRRKFLTPTTAPTQFGWCVCVFVAQNVVTGLVCAFPRVVRATLLRAAAPGGQELGAD
jgi:hypothetical protein